MKQFKKMGLTVLVAVISSVLTLTAFNHFNFQNQYSASQSNLAAKFAAFNPDNFKGVGPVDFRYAAAITTPAVVHIETTYAPKNTGNDYNPFKDFFGNDFFFGMPQQPYSNEPEMASGSGVIISNDGYIVTNNHVVEDGDKINVILFDKKNYEATVIGTDPSTDLALLKIDESNLPFMSFGNSDSVVVGEWVLAVGNPFNLESTVTAGIVSAKGRNINILKGSGSIEAFIQTDAAVNPGNSGGALVNTSGELIGINSAIATPTGSYAGYSFAVPVNIVKKVMSDLMKYGVVQRGYLGIGISDMTGDLAKDKGLDNLKGVYVDSIYSGSSAQDAGLKIGDVIIKINGIDVNSSPELQEQIAKYHPGDKIVVTYNRKGEEHLANVTLKNKQGGTSYVSKEDNDSEAVLQLLGAEFSNLSSQEMKTLHLSGGVKVTKLSDGKLSRNTNIREGFIITKVDNKNINNIDDLKAALENKTGGVMLEGVYPNGSGQFFYAFGL